MAGFYLVGRDTAQVPINYDSWTLDTYAPIHYAIESPIGLVNEHVDVRGEHATVIREVGRASAVLLKNTNNALPLTGQERQVAIIGEDAGSNPYGANGCSDRGCDNGTNFPCSSSWNPRVLAPIPYRRVIKLLTILTGTLAMGWGSGTANFPYLVTPEQAIQNYVLTQTGGEVFAILDNFATSQIASLASQASVAIVFVNADSGEGYISVDGNEGDRNNLTLWNGGDSLIQNVSALCNNTVVVMHTVGPVLVSDWYDNENVTAILWAGLPGQESGNSLVDVLYGAYTPGGKLPFTIGPDPASYGTDVLYEPNNGEFGAPQLDFTEGVFIDYRAFDKAGITPIYEFGFGLSYTTFSYAGLTVTPGFSAPYTATTGETTAAPSLGNFSTDPSQYLFPNSSFPHIPLYIYPYLNSTDLASQSADPDYGEPSSEYLPAGSADGSPQPLLPAGGAPGGNPGLYDVLYEVSATITNTGGVIGDEVAQLYVSLGGDEPAVVLRGFDRITIAAGASATFTAQLTRRDLSTWDTTSQNWVISTCPVVYVGSSSRNLPLSASLGSCSSTASSSASVGYGPATSAVSQISEGQPQAPTYTTAPVSTIWDGQPEVPPTVAASAVSQTSDGQPQATTA